MQKQNKTGEVGGGSVANCKFTGVCTSFVCFFFVERTHTKNDSIYEARRERFLNETRLEHATRETIIANIIELYAIIQLEISLARKARRHTTREDDGRRKQRKCARDNG